MPDDDDLPRILSLISHELRSPLGVVRGYLRMLDQRPDTTDQDRTIIAAALRATDRALTVLEQGGTLAELRGRETAPDIAATPVDPLLDAAVAAATLGDDPRVTVEREATPGLVVEGDLDALRRAIASLISAVARAQTVEQALYVSATSAPGPPGADANRPAGVLVDIRAAQGAHVEEAFDTSRGGLGLDLPIADAIVAAHGGRIREMRDGRRPSGYLVWLPAPRPSG